MSKSSSSSPPPYDNSSEPVFAQHSQTPVAAASARRIISTACTLSPRLKVCTRPGAMEATVSASGATGNGDTSDHGSLSQSAPTSPFITRLASNGASAKTSSFAPLSPYALSASYNLLLPRATSPASTTPTVSVASASSSRVRTGSIGGILRAGRDPRPPVAATATAAATAEQLLRLPHQRTLSVQSLAASGYTGSGSPTSAVAPGLERAASSSGSSSNRQSRRCSVAVSTNLSITQGLPVDPDRLEMDEDEDDDDDSDGYHSSGILSAHSDGGDESDFEADDDSMDLDGVADAASVGQQSSLASAALTRRGRRSSHHHHNHSNPMAHDVASAGSTPRNKAFERLRSLVEEDKQVLASEMEHEGQITRSIRHSSVQEWLRRSSSAGLSSSPGPAADDAPSALTLAALRGSGSAARPTESSAPSMVSSPGLTTALNVAGAVAATVGSDVSTVAYPPAGAGMPLCSAVPASRKRKIADDDGASSGGDATTDEPSTPHSHQQYKRLAMSPSGLRVQIGMGASGGGSSTSSSSRRVIFAPTQSGPSSPLLGSVPRPIAMAVSGGTHYPSLQGGVLGGGNGKSPINRVRSRSGAMPLGSSGTGYYGSASIGGSGSGANIMQANGVFSRMNISDKKTGTNQDPP
ncbi:hypothetical protein IWW48_004564 [Coemansia sp. RSA 1200]|nr:hypothetical protein IWW48_004564 [Coemansia sp. RSA 1200]